MHIQNGAALLFDKNLRLFHILHGLLYSTVELYTVIDLFACSDYLGDSVLL